VLAMSLVAGSWLLNDCGCNALQSTDEALIHHLPVTGDSPNELLDQPTVL
jgi:uncharacterized membrane protein